MSSIKQWGPLIISFIALVVAITSALFAYQGNNTSKKALDNASPAIQVEVKVGQIVNDKFVESKHVSLLSLDQITSDLDWAELIFTNGGGRRISVDDIGIKAANGQTIYSTQIDWHRLLGCNSGTIGCPGTADFTVEPTQRVARRFPLWAEAEFLRAGNEAKTAGLTFRYKSSDVMDKGRDITSDISISP
ncbi:hypothetical protein [Nocardia sp. CA-119907]|uniref:hypothetical protein n=1 Tax=Nocardia sp. CA-119907 TaxID=3239973 RepID=UPI003D951CFD